MENEMRRFTTFCLMLVTTAMLYGITELRTSNHVIETAHASSTTPEWDVCGLHAVECEGEEPWAEAVTEIPHTSPITTERIKTAYRLADEAGVSGDILMHVAWCESQLWNTQSQLHYTFSDARRGIVRGEQERSFGWYMIHTPDHDITEAQALDVTFSILWAIEQMKADSFPWYGYDAKRDQCANEVKEYWL